MELPVLFFKAIFFFTLCGGIGSLSVAATEFSPGDFVQITSDEDVIRELHSHGIGFVDGMGETLGKIGKINFIDSDGDLKVAICGTTWFYSAKAVTKLASGGGSPPQISSDCYSSEAIITVTQETVGSSVKLECSVVHQPDDSSLRWINGGTQIKRTSCTDSEESSLELILDQKPEDAGWYTCELRDDDDDLRATAALELKVTEAEEKFEVGDLVQITSDEDLINELHSHGIGFNDYMIKTLGKIGRVRFIDGDGDLNVAICDDTWYYSAKAVTKLCSAGTTTPSVSSDCYTSDAIITVKQETVGSSVKLECSVVYQPDDSSLRWMKGDTRIKTKSCTDSEKTSFELILEEKPENAGWYTCELRDDDDDLRATAALELKAKEAEEKFEVGDLVKITSDEDFIAEQHQRSLIGYNDYMKKTLGKIGRVIFIDSDGDLRVAICDRTWYYSTKVVTKLCSAGTITPLVSSDCYSSDAIITVKQETVGRSVKLECSVVHQPDDSSLRWMKGDNQLKKKSSIDSPEEASIVLILDEKPEDAGWYTCELRDEDDDLRATAALELKVKEAEEKFADGDLVQITSDEELIEELHSHGIGYPSAMEPTLGKIGRVKFIDDDGDLNVAICGDTWYYSAKAVTKLTSAGTTAPLVFSDCVRSSAVITVKQHTVGGLIKLECSVEHHPDDSILKMWKGDEQIRRKSVMDTSVDSIVQTVEMTPDDAGWYTCAVLNEDDKVAAVGASEIKVTSSFQPVTTTTPAAGGEFEVGDVVQVLSDEDRVREINEDRVGFVDEMRETLGKIGKVLSVDSDKDLFVEICGDTWYYSPDAVIKIASVGSSQPTISSHCVSSVATISITKKREGDDVTLDCTVHNKPYSSQLRWVNKDGKISEDSPYSYRHKSRFAESSRDASRTSRLQITNIRPEDEGWYTCQLIDDGLAAVAAVKVDVVEGRALPGGDTYTKIFIPKTSTTPDTAVQEFKEGDVVQVLSDEDTVKERFGDRIGFTREMRKTLGKIGKVITVDSVKDLRVQVCGDIKWYSPDSVIKLASSREGAPEISSDCARSDATVSITGEKSSDSTRLTCTVVNKPYGSHVSWIKDGARISRDGVRDSDDSRITISSDPSTQTYNLQINDNRPSDDGWYTCELRGDELLATAAVKVAVGEARDPPGEVWKPAAADEKFVAGEIVQVLSNEETVKERFGSLNFPEEMRQTLGKIGRVILQDYVDDVKIEICGTKWWYKPNTLVKLSSSGRSTPEISSECSRSDVTVRISEQRLGNTVSLTCEVGNKPDDSRVVWIKDGERIYENIKYTLRSDFSSKKYTLEIDNIEPDDAGWYTCQVTTHGDVVATTAWKLEVYKSSTTQPTTSTTTEATVTADKFAKGDIVWVLSDKEKVERLEDGHGGWTSAIEESLGKLGRVSYVYADDDLTVEICNTSWLFNPKAVIKIASAGDGAPETSSNCISSEATVNIKQEAVGSVTKLICTVSNQPDSSYVYWVKGGEEISRDGYQRTSHPRIGTSYSISTNAYTTLQITDMRPEDAGWYTCELRDRDSKLYAVKAVELKVQPREERIAPSSCVDCSVLTSIDEQLLDIKYLITNSTSELRSKIDDVSERLEAVERRFLTPTAA